MLLESFVTNERAWRLLVLVNKLFNTVANVLGPTTDFRPVPSSSLDNSFSFRYLHDRVTPRFTVHHRLRSKAALRAFLLTIAARITFVTLQWTATWASPFVRCILNWELWFLLWFFLGFYLCSCRVDERFLAIRLFLLVLGAGGATRLKFRRLNRHLTFSHFWVDSAFTRQILNSVFTLY